MMPHSIEVRLRIAIVGAGIAGAALAFLSTKHQHLSFQIYEAAPGFALPGHQIWLSDNAEEGLRAMSHDIISMLLDDGAVRLKPLKMIMGTGRGKGTVLADAGSKSPSLVVDRAKLLEGLLKHVPKSTMHAEKQLVGIEESQQGLTLHFMDGSEEHVDAVVGADGSRGYTRQHILGAEHPALQPSFAGSWQFEFLVPADIAREALGAIGTDENQHVWVDDGACFMYGIRKGVMGEEIACCRIMAMTENPWLASKWKEEAIDPKTLLSEYPTWRYSLIAGDMVKLLRENSEFTPVCHWHHKIHAPFYAKGRVCIIGDAAHKTTPWKGLRAGESIEDAFILDALFAGVQTPQQIDFALKPYDEIRRPITQEIVERSMTVGRVVCGKEPGIGLDCDLIRKALLNKCASAEASGIEDLHDHKRAALERFAELSRTLFSPEKENEP